MPKTLTIKGVSRREDEVKVAGRNSLGSYYRQLSVVPMAIAAVIAIPSPLQQTQVQKQERLAIAPSQQFDRPPAPKAFSVPSKFQNQIVYEVKLKEKVIALTLDDGPWPETTLQMLGILKQNDVKATFFWTGQAVKQHPQLAQRVVADGHAIGNHTMHHWYHHMGRNIAAREIDDTAALIYQTTGVKTSLFRPPGGFLKNGLAGYAKQQKYAVVMWSVSSADTDRNAQPQAYVNNVLKGAKPGAIVLMHDGGGDRSKSVKALPLIIAGLKQQGYRFVTVPELLEMQQPQK
ncbi:MAG: polysaccharide deacetylase family protein [Cyanosarcina radialis HA8281-LM2]|nr:polysaccharide deacetylase family protein [Cyanosarcina radialis HA8281-LM2]